MGEKVSGAGGFPERRQDTAHCRLRGMDTAEVHGPLRSCGELGPSCLSSGRGNSRWTLLVPASEGGQTIQGDAQDPPGQGIQNPREGQ